MNTIIYILALILIVLLFICSLIVIKFFRNKAICELSTGIKKEEFIIRKGGKYSIWIKDKRYSFTNIRDLRITVANKNTGEKKSLEEVFYRSKGLGVIWRRVEIYCFQADEGEYIISFESDERFREFIFNTTIQVRKYISIYKIALVIFVVQFILLIISILLIIIFKNFN